jgi:sulfur-oxidizing protein SoxZ
MAARTLINVPPKAKRGEVIQIKTLISHIEEIFKAALYQAIAANPFITFHTVATESGTFAFQWTGDNGFTQDASAKITVE